MAEIGIHRLAAGDDQHQRAQNQQRLAPARLGEKRDAVNRVEGGKDFWLARDLRRAQRRDDGEPDDQQRTEDDADLRRAAELNCKKARQQKNRDRQNIGRERRGGDLEPLDGREHADRGRDHAVAKQQPGAEHQRPEQRARALVAVFVQEAVEREDAALAFVLRPQHQRGVFDRDDQRDGPDRERDRAEHVFPRRRDIGGADEDLVDRVKRRCADIAKDDAERAQRERRQARAANRLRRTRQPTGLLRKHPIQ